MTHFVRLDPWLTNPAYLPQINRGHPLARGLTNFVLTRHLRSLDLITLRRTTAGNLTGLAPQLTPFGIGLRGASGSTKYIDVPVVQNTGPAQVTYIMGIVPSSITSAGIEERIWDNATTDNTVPKMTRNRTGSAINMYSFYAGRATSGGAFDITQAATTIGAAQFHCVTTDYASADSNADLANGTFQWFINGFKQSVTVATNGSGDTTEPATVRLLGIQAASRGFDGVMLYWGKYNRILPPLEAAAVSLNPFQLFMPQPRSRVTAAAAGLRALGSAASAGGGLGLSAAGAGG